MNRDNKTNYYEDETKHRFMEYPISPSPYFPVFWDKIIWNLRKIYPNHYNVPEDIKIKIKRSAKRKMFDYILKISKEVLTKEQYEAFTLYYDFYPRKTTKEIAQILGTTDDSICQKLRRARFRIVKFFYENTKNLQMKNRLGKYLEEYRRKINEYHRRWYKGKKDKEKGIKNDKR